MIKVFIFVVLLGSGSFDFVPEKHGNWSLLPHNTCGQVSSNRIIGGAESQMNAYPWMARIGYATGSSSEIKYVCGGALVNADTVITAAHCMKFGAIQPKVIRLGEHNVETNPDCDGSRCADPVVDVAPLKVLIPMDFDTTYFTNDIAIIRLKEKVKFSDSIRPICIGGSEFMKKNFVGSEAEVAGWGKYNNDIQEGSKVLKYVSIPVVDTKVCLKEYGEKYITEKKHVCAGGKIGEDSCSGDSGGPLMIIDDGPTGPRYYLLGVVSFGPTDCGASELPAAYSNISYFLKWFLDQM